MMSENPTSHVIRAATADDIPAVYRLFMHMDEQHATALPVKYRASQLGEWNAYRFEEHLSRPDTLIVVACEAETIIGVVYAVMEEAPPLPLLVQRQYTYIRALAVEAAYRRRGIGNALLNAAQAWAHSMGHETIELSVAEFNSGAMELYERAGYATVTRRMVKRLTHQSD